MATELKHPGYLDYNLPLAAIHKVRNGLTFAKFRPFIHTGGLSERDGMFFEAFLGKLFEETGDLWMPRFCRTVSLLETASRGILTFKFPFSGAHIARANFSDKHYWLKMTLKRGPSPVIIDPYGASTELDWSLPETIHPFFGLTSEAHPTAKEIYGIGL